MAPAGVVEPVDALEDGRFGPPPRWPALPPDDFGLQGFEKRLDGGVCGNSYPCRSSMDAGHRPAAFFDNHKNNIGCRSRNGKGSLVVAGTGAPPYPAL